MTDAARFKAMSLVGTRRRVRDTASFSCRRGGLSCRRAGLPNNTRFCGRNGWLKQPELNFLRNATYFGVLSCHCAWNELYNLAQPIKPAVYPRCIQVHSRSS
jgi:hypothetical protein